MQGELCRYGNLVITSSSLHSPSRLLLPTTLLPRAFHLEETTGGREGWREGGLLLLLLLLLESLDNLFSRSGLPCQLSEGLEYMFILFAFSLS